MSYRIFGGLVLLGGLALVGWQTHPLVALGVFMIVWGNNIALSFMQSGTSATAPGNPAQ